MTNTQAILIGAGMIAAAVLITGLAQPAAAQQHGGPYMLMHHSNTLANAGVFRLDTTGGGVSYCFVGSDTSLACTREVK